MATGWPRDLLRTVVLKTNPYPPFRQCNRWPYRLAIERVGRAFCSLPALKALYLRHGLASSSWIAGLSDIDFTVVLKPELSAKQEFDILYNLRARYRRIQRWFPMLGELDVLSEEDLTRWISLTNSTPFPRSWTLLHGSPVFDPTADCSPDWRSRALAEALGFYVFELWPYLSRPDSYLSRADTERRMRKIERLLAPALEAPGEGKPAKPGTEIAERIATMLRDLETVAALVDPMDAAVRFEGPYVRIPYCGASIAICRDGVTAGEVARLLAAAQPPVILTARLFGYFARKYNPYDYDYLCREWSKRRCRAKATCGR